MKNAHRREMLKHFRDARTALMKMITDLMDIITGTEMIIDSDGYDYGKYSFF